MAFLLFKSDSNQVSLVRNILEYVEVREDYKGVSVNSYIVWNSGVKELCVLKNAYDMSIVKNNLSDSICYNIGIINNNWPGQSIDNDNNSNLVNNISA